MNVWLYEDGHLVAKDAAGTVLFRREMAEHQARRMADLVNIETDIGDHLIRKRKVVGVGVPAPVVPAAKRRH